MSRRDDLENLAYVVIYLANRGTQGFLTCIFKELQGDPSKQY